MSEGEIYFDPTERPRPRFSKARPVVCALRERLKENWIDLSKKEV